MTGRTRSSSRSVLTTIVGGGLLAALLLPGTAVPASADDDAPECGDSATIAGRPTITRTLADGVILRSWGSRVADVDVVSVEPGSAALRVWTAPAGTVQNVRTVLDGDRDALAAINGDFFTGGGMGRNPMANLVINGQPKYLVPQDVPALTIDPKGALHATTVHADGAVTFRWLATTKHTVVRTVTDKKTKKKVTVRTVVTKRTVRSTSIPISGVNSTGNLTNGTAVLFTRTWPSSIALPQRVRVLRLPSTPTPQTSTPPVSKKAAPTRPWIALGSVAAARIARVPASAVARFTWDVRAADGSPVRDAIGRGAVLLRDGGVITDCAGDDRPRTAVGWDQQGHVWIMTSQGGERETVIVGARMGGTTNFQMAQWLHQLGATDGVTFDGGGSTDLEVRTDSGLHRADLPDDAYARPVPNGLILAPRG